MMSKRKKIVVSVCLVFLLVATVYVNVLLSTDVTASEDITVSDYFSEYRSERTTTRQEQLLNLDSIIATESLDAEVLADAAAQKMSIVAVMDAELTLESLIGAKGFEDVVVTMSYDSDDINVIVKADELTQTEVAQIYEVISSETNATYANVKIIPVS
ncbi:MAG: SpoIIIAH-like family protein [Bacillota bacterium]